MLASAQSMTSTQTFDCPDDGQVDCASNVAGTTDKVLTITPGSGSDQSYVIEVYKPEDPTKVLDTVTITPENQPPITVPPGAKARARDPHDGDSLHPKGTATLT